MATNTISLLSLDVGFDLRETKHPITLPPVPFACKYSRDNKRDDCTIVTLTCRTDEDVASLRRELAAAGYVVAEPEEE
jgi:hypothetical protein